MADDYAEDHHISELIETLRTGLLKTKPAKPVEWLTERLTHADMAQFDLSGEERARVRRTLSASRPTYFKPQQAHIISVAQYNKGTAFTEKERELLGLQGLLPYQVETLSQQVARCEAQVAKFEKPIQKFTYLTNLKETNQTLFYSWGIKNLQECLPIVYTPTVGEACVNFDGIFSHPQGMYITTKHTGRIRQILDNWVTDVDIIVVSDGSRILGLGDLGANGMGIPVGKLILYVLAAGFHPARTLPILVDTGCSTKKYVEEDPFYLGEKRSKMSDDEYYGFLDEFVMAVKNKWPECVLQFEDFSNDHCFALLERYRKQTRCFNDDIQGTGAVVAAGFVSAAKLSGVPLDKQVILFYGAGSAGVGVAEQIMGVMASRGVDAESARKAFYLIDTKGLVTNNRGDKLQAHKIPWARTDQTEQIKDLIDIVKKFKPTAMIGLSGTPNVFTEEIVKEMAKHTTRPIIFPLSNPTSKAECSAEQAYKWTDGKAIFAAGSPFAPVTLNGTVYTPGQGNNMYIFPGLGMGSFLSRATEISDEMILTAAETLVDCVTDEMLAAGSIYPPLNMIRDISLKIAVRVMEQAQEQGLSGIPYPPDLSQFVAQNMWSPTYFEAK
jgi:malic enzyme